MFLTELSLEGFISEIASPSPVPGGGSCAAYSSAVGAALVEMIAHLTFGRKAYDIKTDDEKEIFESVYEYISRIKDEFIILVNKDTEAFEKVMATYKMPEDTEEKKELKKQAIDDATWLCVDIPYKICLLSKKSIEQAVKIIHIGNQKAISDLGVGILMLYTGLEGAVIDIKMNLMSVNDKERALKFIEEVDSILEETRKVKDDAMLTIYNLLK